MLYIFIHAHIERENRTNVFRYLIGRLLLGFIDLIFSSSLKQIHKQKCTCYNIICST